ncbi:MAG TPA: VIT and VWA domain-containing protein [Candidatus Goldiibacteriota bacterium]|nr:VIT and VWA domain-containing protein [Candidatus Goldiibacteriota bacterium]HRQ45018.1 VIT and VWA domain-containing protein [Candidatus Goldiibacteriota bacterium]
MKNQKKLFLALLFVVLSAVQALACRIAVLPYQGRVLPIETRKHDVNISIKNQVADITVNALFYNPNSTVLEGDYWFPLYEDAAVTSFTMIVNGKEMKAEILEADKARAIYEEIVRRMKDPALLEFAGTRMLRQRVYPIPARGEVALVLKYTQQLKTVNGKVKLVYPLSSAKSDTGYVGEVNIKVNVEDSNGIKNVYSSGHAIKTNIKEENFVSASFNARNYKPDKPFVFYYSPAAGEVAASIITHVNRNDDGYFTLLLSPSIEDSKEKYMPKDFVFVLDKSGSMQGDKIEKAKDALQFCVNTLKEGDRLGIIAFSSSVDAMSGKLKNFSYQESGKAKNFIRAIDAEGGTDINSALQDALSMLKKEKGRLPVIVFLTDGLPTVGETDIMNILKNTKHANRADARIFVFGVGEDVNTGLLDKMSADNGGDCEYVINPSDSIEESVSSLASRIASPALAGITLSFDGSAGVYDIYPKRIPDMFAGSQITVTGRFKGNGMTQVKVSGETSGSRKEFRFPVDFSDDGRDESVMKLWASKKVTYLMDEINLKGRNKEIENEIIKLGKKYGIVTPYTSFLITDESLKERALGGRSADMVMEDLAQAKTGSFAVMRSKSIAKAKKAEAAAPASMMPSAAGMDMAEAEEMNRQISASVVNAGGRAFVLDNNGRYTDTEFNNLKDKAKKVKYLSEEYFKLSAVSAEVSEILSLGNKVLFKSGNDFYEITE